MAEDSERKKVKEYVNRLRGFYTNLTSYVVVNILLIIINLITSPDDLWFYWVSISWGIVLVLQWVVRDRFLCDKWEKRKIEEILNKKKSNKGS